MWQPVQHRGLPSGRRHESPLLSIHTRLTHDGGKVASLCEAAIGLVESPGDAPEVERDARVGRMVGKGKVEAAAAIKARCAGERVEVH